MGVNRATAQPSTRIAHSRTNFLLAWLAILCPVKRERDAAKKRMELACLKKLPHCAFRWNESASRKRLAPTVFIHKVSSPFTNSFAQRLVLRHSSFLSLHCPSFSIYTPSVQLKLETKQKRCELISCDLFVVF